MIMKRISYFLVSALMLVLTACGPSEEEILAASKQAATDFFQAITFENEEKINAMYPEFQNIGVKLSDVSFKNTMVGDAINNGDDTYSVSIPVVDKRDNDKVVILTMKPTVLESENIQFEIVSSKGLTIWEDNKQAIALGCWTKEDNLTDAEYYQRYLISDSIATKGAELVMKEVSEKLKIEFGSFPAYYITNRSKYSFSNSTITYTFVGEINNRNFRGNNGKVKTVTETYKNVGLKSGEKSGAFSDTGDAYKLRSMKSKKVIIPIKQAKRLFVNSAKGTEYTEYMASQGTVAVKE